MDALDHDRAIDEIEDQEKAAKIAGLKEALAIVEGVEPHIDELEFLEEIREALNKRISELET